MTSVDINQMLYVKPTDMYPICDNLKQFPYLLFRVKTLSSPKMVSIECKKGNFLCRICHVINALLEVYIKVCTLLTASHQHFHVSCEPSVVAGHLLAQAFPRNTLLRAYLAVRLI